MAALTRSISVIVDAVEDAAIEEEEAAAVAAQEQDREAAELASLKPAPASNPVPAPAPAAAQSQVTATDLSQASMRLQILSDRLVLHSIPRRDIDVYFRKLLRLICFTGGYDIACQDSCVSMIMGAVSHSLFPRIRSTALPCTPHRPARVRFFSFLWLQDELSLILDAAAYLALISDGDNDGSVGGGSAPLPELWRAIRVVGEFGFTETGIVYALSAPLAARGVGVFYISTFKTDFIMVRDSAVDVSSICLSLRTLISFHFLISRIALHRWEKRASKRPSRFYRKSLSLSSRHECRLALQAICFIESRKQNVMQSRPCRVFCSLQSYE